MSDTFFLIIGAILSVFGLLLIASVIIQRLRCTAEIPATVTKLRSKKIGFWRGKTLYTVYPTFRYGYQGRDYTAEAPYSNHAFKRFQTGDRLAIRIDPKKPDLICCGFPLSLLLTGIPLSLGGLTLIICFFL